MSEHQAVVRHGQLEIKDPLPFPDGTAVTLRIEPISASATAMATKAKDEDPLLYAITHAIDTGIPDLAEQHDHYIYGSPKRTKE